MRRLHLAFGWAPACIFGLALGSLAADVSPAAHLGIKVGDKFSYVTEGAPATAAQRPGYQDQRGAAMVSPLPKRETVVVSGSSACSSRTCLAIEADLELPPFVPGIKADSFGKKVKATIDPDSGAVTDVATSLTMGTSVSDSHEKRYAAESTLADFFGPWMLELADGYDRSFNMATGEVREFKVVGHEKVAGRDCFVVVRSRGLPGGQAFESRLWVDAGRRIALQVEQEGERMHLVHGNEVGAVH